MKKFFYSVLAVATMLFATTSCSQEDEILGGGTSPGGNTQKVTFKVGVPDEDAASRAIADGVSVGGGNKADNLIWALYEKGKKDELGNPIKLDCGHVSGTKNDATGKHEFVADITMVKGLTYEILFFAYDDENCAFQLASTVEETDLTALTLNTELVANEEGYDAFVKCHPYTFGGETDVVLTRPFAQINAATTLDDLDKAKKLQAVVTTSELVINEVPTQYNVLTGEATSKANLTYKANEILTKYPAVTDGHPNEDITVNEVGYKYLTMAYVLAGETKDSKESMHNATFKFYREGDANSIRTIEIPNLPIQRNYRTNVVGDLITRTESFKIVIDEGFGGDINKVGVINGLTYIRVKNAEEFNAAFVEEKYDMIILDADIALTEPKTRAADPVLTISSGKALTIDLNGKKLSAISSETGKNYNMFDVRGTLTVKNGKMEYEHKGENMAWNNSTNLFNVTAGGVLNLEDVEAKNLGGSDMAFVAHLNNWGEVTLNVNNSTLESIYIPVRVFNSGNDMNNVTIKNTTLNGKYCFWVHNYTLVDFGNDQEKFEAHKALLNFDIFNVEGVANNTFTFNNSKDAPVLYGFTDAVYFDEYGRLIWDGTSDTSWYNDTETEFTLSTPAQLAGLSELVDGGNTFEGKTIILDDDIDLYQVDENGEAVCFNPIGSYRKETPFKGIFDGQNHTIKNLNQNTWALDNGYYYGDLGLGLFGKVEDATVKNLVMDNANISGESAICGVVAATAYGDCTFENITVKNSKCADYQYYSGGIVGWASGDHQYINCNVDASTTVAAQWGDFDNSIGGVIGGAGGSATIYMKDCNVACRIDAYNDVTSTYQWYAYRRCGMLIGNTGKTVDVDGTTYAAAPQLTCENVTVTYGDWANYTYCEFAGKSWPYVRVQAGVSNSAYSNPRYGHPTDANGNEVVDDNHVHHEGEDHHILCVFDQLYGGGQGVYGKPTHDGVTVVYNNK